MNFRSIFWEIMLALFGIGIFRLRSVMRRDAYIRKHRSSQDCLYFWMYAADPGSRSGEAARILQKAAYQLSDSKGLPILAETSVPKNKRVYERMGFRTYHEWKDAKSEMVTWLMDRQPAKSSNQK